MVLMLAVLHHILVTEGIPLAEIVDLAAELTTRSCILEFIAPGDPMFRKLLHGRKHLYDGLTAAAFEQLCAGRFDIVASRRLGSADRWIYHLQKKT